MTDPISRVAPCISVVAGSCVGPALVLDEPLSLWGGLDSSTGQIIDAHHPQCGMNVGGTVLVMASGRGSSSASSVLAEAARRGTSPAGFVLFERDEIVALGALVASELYGLSLPVVVVDPQVVAGLANGTPIAIAGHELTIG